VIDVQRIAAACTPEVLKALPDEELLALADAVGREAGGEEIVKAPTRTSATERKLAREVHDRYVEDVLAAADEVLDDLPETDVAPEQVDTALRKVGERLPDPGERFLALVAGAAAALLLLGRRAVRARLRTSGAPSGRKVSGTLTLVDRGAIDAMSGQQLWWIGGFWSQQLSRVISATVAREAVSGGLGRDDVGQILRGVVKGEFPAAQVPNTYRGSPRSYFELVAGEVRSRASNSGALHAFVEARIERYRFEAVNDERTTKICLFLDGRIFTVEAALAAEERALAARDPEEFKQIAGWRTLEELQRVAGSGERAEQNRNLELAGMAVPPLHGRCRSVIVEE